MKLFFISFFLYLFLGFHIMAQRVVKGIISNGNSQDVVSNVSVTIVGTDITQKTEADGVFMFKNVPNGKQHIKIEKTGFETQELPIIVDTNDIDLGVIFIYPNAFIEEQGQGVITLTDDELDDEFSFSDNISGLLQASKDVFLRTVAFEWSPSFYRIRGFDSKEGKVLINGIEMNKSYNGRPQWSNWGGLNDVTRNQDFTNGLAPSDYSFGGALGVTNISTRASEYQQKTSISYASSNRSYKHRMMASYSSGLLPNGWAFTLSASSRIGNEGYVEGTSYHSNAAMISVEKKINEVHSLNLTAIYSQNKRGKQAPNTQEVYDLKGIRYNPYWGYQEGTIRNSRIKRIDEPIVMMNHYWNVTDRIALQTAVAYQFGEVGNSRLDYKGSRLLDDGVTIVGGASNPDPTYYQKLPSFFMKNNDNSTALQSLLNFQHYGQLNWEEMYRVNLSNSESQYSKYILFEDRNDDNQFTANAITTIQLNQNITLNGGLHYTWLQSENFANVLDLLGGTGYLDVNPYGINNQQKQTNLQNPNRVVGVNDIFKYHYKMYSNVINGFIQGQFNYRQMDFYLAANVGRRSYQRVGLYQNGAFPKTSLGNSDALSFTNFSSKAGITYKITGRHLLRANGGYWNTPPTIRQSFSNPQENNHLTEGIKNDKKALVDFGYVFRGVALQAKLTGYYALLTDQTEVSFYYADGLAGDDSAFVQETTTGINTKHTGIELGIEYPLSASFKIKGAANIGQYVYDNNPYVSLTSDDASFSFVKRRSFLKNYKVAAGPQQAYSFGFEYRDPDYWWMGVTGNYLANTYIAISKLKRTSNYASDTDGLPFSDYDATLAKSLLKQERFRPYFLLNAVGGKSWKVGKTQYIGFFATISNILDTAFKTGGFEQARTLDYRSDKEDASLKTRLFGNKYWYGRGTSYFASLYYRF